MRHVVLAGALAVAALVTAGGAAQAQERQYPWCARYDWSTSNCGFVSYNQCMATVSGVGGYCEPNPRAAYAQPVPQRVPKKRYRQNYNY